MGTPPSQLPPAQAQPPAPVPSTQFAGQQTVPASVVPTTPAAPIPSTQTNTLAVVSLVTALLSFAGHLLFIGGGGLIGAVLAIVFGHMARREIRRTGERGMGIATAGMVIGYAHLVMIAIGFVIAVLAWFLFGLILFGALTHHG